MPFKRDTPDIYLSREDILPSRLRDVIHHFHGAGDSDNVKDNGLAFHTNKLEGSQSSMATQLLSALELSEDSDEDSKTGSERTTSKTEGDKMPRTLHSSRTNEHPQTLSDVKGSTAEVGSTEPASDSDYELISGPASVEALSSDSDTDTDMLDHQTSSTTLVAALPLRIRNVVDSMDYLEPSSSVGNPPGLSDSDSDAEWALL